MALGAAVVSVASKEAIARATERVGAKHNSLPLKVNAMHHRSDALSSVVAAVGIAGAMAGGLLLEPGSPWRAGLARLDPLSGLIVAGFLGKMALEVWGEALAALVDANDEEVATDVAAALHGRRWPGHVAAFSGIRARRMGSRHHVDFTVTLLRGGHDDQQKQQHEMPWSSSSSSSSSLMDSPSFSFSPSFFPLSDGSPLYHHHHHHHHQSHERSLLLAGILLRQQQQQQQQLSRQLSAAEAVKTTRAIREMILKEIPSVSEVCIQLE